MDSVGVGSDVPGLPTIMDRPRGRPTGGRARGKAPQEEQSRGPSHQQSRGPSQQQAWGPPQQQQKGPPQQQAWGPPLQQQKQQPPAQAAPPPQQSAWTARGRGSGPPAPSQQPPQQQQAAVGQLAQQMTRMTVTARGEPGASSLPRGTEQTRGTVRQRPIDDVYVFRSKALSSKQGTKGQSVQLQANFFKFVNRTDVSLYQYRVDFNPDVEVTHVRKAILRHHKDVFGRAYIFDGTVLFTMQRLKEGLELTTKDKRDDSIVRILIKLTTDLQMGDPHYVMFMNQIFRNCLAKMELQLVNRNYFDAKAKIDLPQHRLEIWPGYQTSIRQHETDLLLCSDLSSKVMRHESALDFLMNCRQRTNDWKRVFEEQMIGSIVITNYNNRTYRIDDIDWDSRPSSTFDMKGRKISYKDYFREKYQINIRSDDQPVLISRPKEKDIRGGRGDKNVSLIPEISCLTGLDDSMRADYTLMKAIADHTRVPPNTRIQKLEQGFMKRLTTTKACQEELNLWNMAFDPKLISFPGRILPPENIILSNNIAISVDPMTGDFTKSLIQKRARLLETGSMTNWAVIYPKKMMQRDVTSFCETMARASSTLGIQIPKPRLEEINDDRSASYVNAIEMLCNSGNCMMIMTIVPNNRADRYEAIKKKCYVQRPVPNQVVLAKNINKNVMSVATKIAIQMSCKIGGSPWTVHIPFKGNTMIVGFDVCHDTRLKSSVGAFVATLNSNYTRYYSSVNHHGSGTEISDSMGTEMIKAVAQYKMNNGAIPDRIFFYRDGVGEGNLHYVLETEVAGIRAQWKAAYNTECPLTFIVVSKRINTRIFYGGGNPPPGTIADSMITLPTMYDFFLVSQSVRQGTVSPTSYNVIFDQQNIKPDIIQQLSYKLTHMYFNWSGTVRVPAPCQYAHKLAFLVGQHLHVSPTGMNDILYFL